MLDTADIVRDRDVAPVNSLPRDFASYMGLFFKRISARHSAELCITAIATIIDWAARQNGPSDRIPSFSCLARHSQKLKLRKASIGLR